MVSYMAHNQTSDDPAPGQPSPSASGQEGPANANADHAPQVPHEAPRELPPAARRALAEAEARRLAQSAQSTTAGKPVELGGRAGPDPVRYGDWEKGGIVSDF